MMTFENQYWLCQNALAVLYVLSALFFLAINDFEKHRGILKKIQAIKKIK
jgi:hypothetical protein